jgi:pteridine reductase
MMTKALAIELNPEVRVNAVAPGAILWPENNINTEEKNKILSKIPLQRVGGEEAIAKTIQFLIDDDSYIHGEIVKVDGGRSVVS